jgi:hypothetical protein
MSKKLLYVGLSLVVGGCILLIAIAYLRRKQEFPQPSPLTQAEIDIIESAFAIRFPSSTARIRAYFDEGDLDSWLWCLIEFSELDLDSFMADVLWVSPTEINDSELRLYMYPPFRFNWNYWSGGERLPWWNPQKDIIKWISIRAKRNESGIVILLEQRANANCQAYLRRSGFTANYPKEIFDVFPRNRPNWDLRESQPIANKGE